MPETFTITFEITTGPDDTGKAQLFWDEFLEDFDGVGTVWPENGNTFMRADFLDSGEAARFAAFLTNVTGVVATISVVPQREGN